MAWGDIGKRITQQAAKASQVTTQASRKAAAPVKIAKKVSAPAKIKRETETVTQRSRAAAPKKIAQQTSKPIPAQGGYNSSLQGFNSSLSADGGMGGGGVAGGGGGDFSAASFAPVEPPAPPAPPVIPGADSDVTFQQQKAELAKAMADFEAQNNLAKSQYDTNFNDGLRKLGWNGGANAFDRNDTQGLYAQALSDNTNDFAARGMIRSGAMAEADSRINNEFATRKSDLDAARGQFQDTQGLALNNFKGQNDLQKQAAMREAIARIAAQQGVGLEQVPLGTL